MKQVTIAAIVEGHGECEAVPILIRRIALEIDPGFVPVVLKPLRVPAARLLKSGEIERSVEFAGRKLQGKGGIIVLVDCDWKESCPKKDGPELLRRAQSARSDLALSVILARMEFEAWFLASAKSLRGKRNLPPDLEPPSDPETIRGAKGWLSARMSGNQGYCETVDQPALTELFDINAARRANSFDKCYRDIRSMLEHLRHRG